MKLKEGSEKTSLRATMTLKQKFFIIRTTALKMLLQDQIEKR